jgi:hypothetical protein
MHGTAAHAHSAAAHTHAAAAHTHAAAAAKMSAATPATEVSTATSTTEVTAASTAAAEMPTTASASASGISNSRQTKGKAYCGRACCDFPHDTTSLSGPNAEANARSPGPFRRSRAFDAATHTPCALQRTGANENAGTSIEMCVIQQSRQTSTA